MKYVDDSKHARELRMDEYGYGWLTDRWHRTHNRTCHLTGRQVTLEDVEKGMYYLSRINADSAYGYEVCPTGDYMMHLVSEIIDDLWWQPMYRDEISRMVGEAKAKAAKFDADIEAQGITVVTDEQGLITEFNNL
jgi:hypothetical protein